MASIVPGVTSAHKWLPSPLGVRKSRQQSRRGSFVSFAGNAMGLGLVNRAALILMDERRLGGLSASAQPR